jgi:hypothetical protein
VKASAGTARGILASMSRTRPELESWTSRVLAQELSAIKRWLHVEVEVDVGAGPTLLLRRVLAWDDSPTPTWAQPTKHGRVTVRCPSVSHADIPGIVSALRAQGETVNEVRRIEPPVSDWNNVASAEVWNLSLPIVAYELWSPDTTHARARSTWSSLDAAERHASGLSETQLGYFGSTVILVPQLRPYLVGHTDLMVPGGPEQWGELRLVSEVFDGGITIARTAGVLRIDAARPLEPAERIHMLQAHYVGATFAEMNGAGPTTKVDGVVALPRDAHGHSGSDWRITVVGNSDADSTTVGLIRGIGGGYFTQEPWRERSPALGFSGPARVIHVPPNPSAGAAAFATLTRAGASACICDPFAEDASLDQVASLLNTTAS